MTLPNNFAALFVQSDNDLLLWTIELQDQEMLKQDGRACGAVSQPETQIGRVPKQFAGLGRQASCPHVAEVDVNAAIFDDGGRRGVRVSLADSTGLLRCKYLDVVDHLARLLTDTQRSQRSSFIHRCRHPNLSAHNNRRRPAFAGKRRLPSNVGIVRPIHRQTISLNSPLTIRPTKPWPVSCSQGCDNQYSQPDLSASTNTYLSSQINDYRRSR